MSQSARNEPPEKREVSPIRRWFRIGPGLLIAIVASVLLWGQMSPQENKAPGIERTRVDVPEAPPSAPDPEWLLKQSDALNLSTQQRNRLSTLKSRWDRETAALRDSLARASTDFNRDMPADGSRPMTMEQIQERAQPVSELSRQLAAARTAWWNEADAVLTATQRKQAQEAWSRRFTPGGDPEN